MNRQRKLITRTIVSLVVLALVLVAVSLLSKSSPKGGAEPDQSVLSAVSQYIQAQQNSIGADQSTPYSWLNSVKSVSTTDWFAKLQPPVTPSTGTVSFNYSFAHQSNYVVKARLSGCLWDSTLSPPKSTSGLVDCSLTDETVDRGTGSSVAADKLPFAWTAVGPQQSPRLSVVKQNNKWLINGDLTGQAQ